MGICIKEFGSVRYLNKFLDFILEGISINLVKKESGDKTIAALLINIFSSLLI